MLRAGLALSSNCHSRKLQTALAWGSITACRNPVFTSTPRGGSQDFCSQHHSCSQHPKAAYQIWGPPELLLEGKRKTIWQSLFCSQHLPAGCR